MAPPLTSSRRRTWRRPPRAPRSPAPTPASARTNPADAASATRLQPSRPEGVPQEDAIRARAYALWQQAGEPDGDGVEFWLRAEQELRNPRESRESKVVRSQVVKSKTHTIEVFDFTTCDLTTCDLTTFDC